MLWFSCNNIFEQQRDRQSATKSNFYKMKIAESYSFCNGFFFMAYFNSNTLNELDLPEQQNVSVHNSSKRPKRFFFIFTYLFYTTHM